jgi:type II secretory pathway pseudopilin PulG
MAMDFFSKQKSIACKQTKGRGFSLIEAIVGIGIFMFVLVGPIILINNSYLSALQARDRLIASSLVQEGHEAVRAIRDSNALFNINKFPASKGWLENITVDNNGNNSCTANGGGPTDGCEVDVFNTVPDTVPVLTPCGGVDCGQLWVEPNGQYVDSNRKTNFATLSPFSRRIFIEKNSNGALEREILVIVEVKWRGRALGASQSVMTINSRLFNW